MKQKEGKKDKRKQRKILPRKKKKKYNMVKQRYTN